LLIQTFIEIPKKVSPNRKKLFRKLAELEQTDVLPERKNFLERIRDYFSWNKQKNHRLDPVVQCKQMAIHQATGES
jgi:hypothetical protein